MAFGFARGPSLFHPATSVNSPTAPPSCPLDPARRLELHLASHTAELSRARKAIEKFAASQGFDETAQAQIGLCVNEAMANVIRHAYSGVTGKPILVIAETPVDAGAVENEPGSVLRITIRDWGNGQNPAALPPKPYNPLEPGGVGLICLRGLMNEVTYTPQPDGMLLTMLKRK